MLKKKRKEEESSLGTVVDLEQVMLGEILNSIHEKQFK